MNKIKIIHIILTAILIIFFTVNRQTPSIVVLSCSLILQVILIKWKKYEKIGLEFSHIMNTIPMALMIQIEDGFLIVIIIQLSMNQNFKTPLRIGVLVVVQLINNYQLFYAILSSITFLLFIFLKSNQREKKKCDKVLKPNRTDSRRNYGDNQFITKSVQKSPDKAKLEKHSLTYHTSIINTKDQFLQIIDEFPEGVALVVFDQNKNFKIDFCNQTMKSLIKCDESNMIDRISKIKKLMTMKQEEQLAKDLQGSLSTYKSFKHIPYEKQNSLGNVRRQFRASTEIKNIDGSMITDKILVTKNVFLTTMNQAKFQIHRQEVQEFLQKTKTSFDLLQILNGYIQNEENKSKERCVEIKIFISFLNKQPQVLILTRDVSHRDYIKLANQQSKAKSNSLHYVTHEIRTPLNCIIQLLENSPQINESTQTALQNCYYLLNFSNDLLDLAQIKVGKFRLVKNIFNLYSVIQSCFDLFKIQSSKKLIKLEVIYQENAPKNIFSDDIRIKQILINLVGNAFKFTQAGSIKVEVIKLQRTLLIKVMDTGLGIKDEDKNKLIKAFAKVDTDESKVLNRHGVGLGLLISNIIAKTLNFKMLGIDIISQYGKGSVFQFEIDYEAQEYAAIQMQIDDAINEMQSNSSQSFDDQIIPSLPKIQKIYSSNQLKFKDFLIIDDEQFQIDSVINMMSFQGINAVDFAINCDHALQILSDKITQNILYKVILIDIEMPFTDGFETYRKIKHLLNNRGQEVPAIVGCSGYSKQLMKQKVIQCGMQDYLEKPLRKADIQYLLANYL
ncbi:hypothetical protein pb186bvf_009546 [Paramecium bursaria]